MQERRRAPRLEEENEVALMAVSGNNEQAKEHIPDSYTIDISMLGARIRTPVLLAVDSMVDMAFTSKGSRERINASGKVKWARENGDGGSYEAGVEFSGEPGDALERLGDYITRILDERITRQNEAAFNSTGLQAAKTPAQAIAAFGGKKGAKTQTPPPVKNSHWTLTALLLLCTAILAGFLLTTFDVIHHFDAGLVLKNINIVAYALYGIAAVVGIYGFSHLAKFALMLKDGFPFREALWTGLIFIGACLSMLVILTLTMNIDYPRNNNQATGIDRNFNVTASAVASQPPVTAQTTAAANTIAPDPPKAAQTAPAAPPAVVTESPKAAQAPAEKQKIKVIGNSDTKRYHLPGMKYYNDVKAYHRVEFDSEEAAVKAGYHKAPR